MKMNSLNNYRPQKRNVNKHKPYGLKLIADSIQRDGYSAPMVAAADGEIFAGSARLEVAGDVLAEAEPIVVHSDGTRPVIHVRDDIPTADDPRARRLGVADNVVARIDYDPDGEILAALAGEDDVIKRMIADDNASMAAMLAAASSQLEDAEPQMDRAEELQEKWQVKPGDIFAIGPHAIICGDCREPEIWRRLLDVARIGKVNGVFTSPPYAEQRKAQYGGAPVSEYVEWWDAVQANVKANLADDGSFFVNIKPNCDEEGERVLYVFDLILAMKREWHWKFIEEFCFIHSGTPGFPQRRFKNQFEPVYQFSRNYQFKFLPEAVIHQSNKVFRKGGSENVSVIQGKRSVFAHVQRASGGAFPGNVLSVGRNSELLGHPAAFSPALPEFFIKAYSDIGDIWLDPFCGSGTTLLAAENNKRRGLGIEKLEKYCAVILQRMTDAFPGIAIERGE